ncbi:DUF6545 domain-containing protein [Micromonospora sp. NPDC048898]|uniref:DUF6545 domain-containing protein n=1 Tax=Micromonospora sp. NPDC048898 TaxID=3364260 RepID=UPI0037123647
MPDPPQPYTVEAWCEAIAAARGRPIRISSAELQADWPPGFFFNSAEADYIVTDVRLPSLTRIQTILHELAHLLLGHRGNALHGDIDPSAEADAEIAADILSRQLARAANAAHRVSTPQEAKLTDLNWRTRDWMNDRWDDWQLELLWVKLRTAVPDAPLILVPHDDEPAPALGGSRRTYRRVVEVHEQLRRLRPWYSEDVRLSALRRAERCGPSEAAAVAEAAVIAVALRRRKAGAPPAGGSFVLPQRGSGHLDIREETRRLAQVSRALHQSPLVHAELARWGTATRDGGLRRHVASPDKDRQRWWFAA